MSITIEYLYKMFLNLVTLISSPYSIYSTLALFSIKDCSYSLFGICLGQTIFLTVSWNIFVWWQFLTGYQYAQRMVHDIWSKTYVKILYVLYTWENQSEN